VKILKEITIQTLRIIPGKFCVDKIGMC